MFGFQGGESADTVARKKSYMKEAQTKMALSDQPRLLID